MNIFTKSLIGPVISALCVIVMAVSVSNSINKQEQVKKQSVESSKMVASLKNWDGLMFEIKF